MTAKRFNYHHDGFGAYYLCDKEEGTYEDSIIGEIWADKSDMINLVNLLNRLYDENEQLKTELTELKASKEDNYNITDGLW